MSVLLDVNSTLTAEAFIAQQDAVIEAAIKLVQNDYKTGKFVNKVSPKKLLNSKWTAMSPINKEKHFMVIEIDVDEDQVVCACTLQAIMSKRDIDILWRDLKDPQKWGQGWK
jgi:tryptophan-rich hypothetical protein